MCSLNYTLLVQELSTYQSVQNLQQIVSFADITTDSGENINKAMEQIHSNRRVQMIMCMQVTLSNDLAIA